jgi:hypothetical protein
MMAARTLVRGTGRRHRTRDAAGGPRARKARYAVANASTLTISTATSVWYWIQ